MPAKLSHRLKGRTKWVYRQGFMPGEKKHAYFCVDCSWWTQSDIWDIAIESANQHNARMNRSREVTL